MARRAHRSAHRLAGRSALLSALLLVGIVPLALAGGGAPPALVQQISADPYTNPTSQHQTQVEPDSFAFGNTVVTAFQSGRFFSGGATDIGWATSKDGGRTWARGFLGLTRLSSPRATTFDRVSDPAVAYDAAHGVWLISTLPLREVGRDTNTALAVNRSSDGLTWGPPITVSPLSERFAHDKNWIACDNGAASPFRGSCYVSWSSHPPGRIVTSTSRDGGRTWSAPVGPRQPARGLGTQPLIRPNGDLLVVYISGDLDEIRVIRSTDGGRTFGPPRSIAETAAHSISDDNPARALRGLQLPSGEVDAAGRLFVAWHDCRFRSGCPSTAPNDVVLASSASGTSWQRPRRVPIAPVTSRVNHIIPGLGVHPETRGRRTRLGLVYYTVTPTPCNVTTCRFGVGFIASNNAGTTWSAPRTLSTQPMSMTWFASTSLGRMVGDYFSTSFVPRTNTVVSVFTLAGPPAGGSFQEHTFAATLTTAASPPPPVPGRSVTLSPSAPVVVFGERVRLRGAVSTRRAGEVVLVGRRARVRTRGGGVWSRTVRPRATSSYRARWRGATSETWTVGVRPRVTVSLQRGALVTRVVAARSFAGRRVLLQRLTENETWETVGRAVLNRRSSATFGSAIPGEASILRVFLPRAQAGRGYLAGFSRAFRVGSAP